MTPSFPPPSPSEPAEPPVPLPLRVGRLLGAGALSAFFAAAPAAVRVASEAHGVAVVWLALTACLTLPAAASVCMARSARDGIGAFTSEEPSLLGWCAMVWSLGSFLGLTVLGALLRATTHHHGLAGVTFAIVGLGFVLALALVIRRLAAIARGLDPFARSAFLGASLVALAVATLLVVLRIARGATDGTLTDGTRDLLLDALAFALGIGIFSRPEIVRASWLGRVGIPLALGVVALGLALLARQPSLAAGIRSHAPLVAPLAALAAD